MGETPCQLPVCSSEGGMAVSLGGGSIGHWTLDGMEGRRREMGDG
jgi:hypothetical protein